MNDLLPCSASPQERAISEAIARLSDVPVLVREQWNPDTCPAALLPWLAWAFSVDEWNSAWSDEQKRGAIKASFYVHQHKGTIGAVKRALSALGFESQIVEWFNDTPEGIPYTFRVAVTVDQYGAEQEQLLPILSVVDSVKNLRSHLASVGVEITSRAQFFVAAATLMGNEITVGPWLPSGAWLMTEDVRGILTEDGKALITE